MRWIVLLLLAACSGEKAAEKPTPAPAAPAQKPGIDAAPGAPATPSGAPPWLIDASPGKGACREAEGALDCSGTSHPANTREEGEAQALDAALAAMAAEAGATVEAIAAARGRQPDDVWWENKGAQLQVYVRARLLPEQRQSLSK